MSWPRCIYYLTNSQRWTAWVGGLGTPPVVGARDIKCGWQCEFPCMIVAHHSSLFRARKPVSYVTVSYLVNYRLIMLITTEKNVVAVALHPPYPAFCRSSLKKRSRHLRTFPCPLCPWKYRYRLCWPFNSLPCAAQPMKVPCRPYPLLKKRNRIDSVASR